MKKIMVIVGSVRKKRTADKVLPLVKEELQKHPELEVDIADLKDIALPFFDNIVSPSNPNFSHEYDATAAWDKRVTEADGFIFLVPEYNYSVPAVLKNAIDWVYEGWHGKPVAYVAWGVDSGVRAVEHLRQIAAWPKMVPLRDATYIPFLTAFDKDGNLQDESVRARIAQTIKQLEEALGA